MRFWLIVGLLLGFLGVGVMLSAQSQSRPPALIYGRTTGGVNVPIQVQSDGTVVLQ